MSSIEALDRVFVREDPFVRRRQLSVRGLNIVVHECGAGEPCLLLHGYPQDHRCWSRVAKLLPNYRLIAPDWFGWGESERSLSATWRYEEEVDRLEALVEALELPRVNLFAHDYGGFLALGYAIRRPSQLARLALCNTRAQRTFVPSARALFGGISWMARTPGLRTLLRGLPLDTLHRVFMHRYVRNGSFSSDMLEQYVRWMGPREGRRWYSHFFRDYSVTPRPELPEGCHAIRVPTSILWGDKDSFLPISTAEELVSRIPDARLARFRGKDHFVLEESPEEVAGALLELLGRPAA